MNKLSKVQISSKIGVSKKINELFKIYDGVLTDGDIFSFVLDACIAAYAERKLEKDDPFSDDDELAVSFANKVINMLDPIIQKSNLPKDKIVAYVARSVHNLADSREAH